MNLKKNGFIEGAMISTVSIVICKIVGLIYVIPFYAIIGTRGGALYSYGYSIYAIFLSLATSGIPIAVSKIVSEYNALDYKYTRERALKIASLIIIGLGILSFLILFIFAPQVAYLMIGNLNDGNTIEGVSMVIRVISTALLIVPILSVKRGYLQGHRYMVIPNLANVIEQVVRVIVIVGGSFFALKVFHLSLETAVGIAVFGATVGAIVAYFYTTDKIKKNKKKLEMDSLPTREEAKITTKEITKKIVFYALPFIFIELIKSAYSMVDVFTVVRTLTNLGYSAGDAENIIGTMTTWASKLNMIVISLAVGLTMSMIPNIAASYFKKDFKDVSRKINQGLQALMVVALPLTIGLAFLAEPVWVVFYGHDALGISVFQSNIFTALTMAFYTILIDATQTMNNTKVSLGTLIGAFILKAILNVPLMYLCNMLHIEAYYGAVLATILTQVIAIIFLLYQLHKHYQVTYKKSLAIYGKIAITTGIMVAVLCIMSLFIPLTASRMMSMVICAVYGLVGGGIYLTIAYKSGLLEDILGKVFLNNMISKLKRKKVKEETEG